MKSSTSQSSPERIEAAVRWEGNNLLAIRDFIADVPAVIEPDRGRCHILFFEAGQVILDVLLEHGDGLLKDRSGLIGVARGMRWSDEKSVN